MTIDLIRMDRELRHCKAQLAGKLGRLRTMLDSRYHNGVYHYSEYAVYCTAHSMGRIGLRYLYLMERVEEAAREGQAQA